MEILVVALVLVTAFAGFRETVHIKEKKDLIHKLNLVTESEMSLAVQIEKKNKQIINLQKTNTLLQAKVESQEQKIKKISQFFSK